MIESGSVVWQLVRWSPEGVIAVRSFGTKRYVGYAVRDNRVSGILWIRRILDFCTFAITLFEQRLDKQRTQKDRQPVCPFAAGFQFGAAKLGLREGGGGEGERRGGTWDESWDRTRRALERARDGRWRRCRRGTGPVATLLIVRRPVARVAPQRARERRRGLRAEAEPAQ